MPAPPAKLSAAARSRLKSEQRLQVEIVEALRPEVEAVGGRLVSICGELPGGRGGKHKAFVLQQAIRRALGYQPGLPDLAVFWPRGRCGLIELKRPKADAPDLLGHRTAAGQLSPEQRAFRGFCREIALPWAMCRSVEETRAALVEWGCLPC